MFDGALGSGGHVYSEKASDMYIISCSTSDVPMDCDLGPPCPVPASELLSLINKEASV